jgi:hypothetical protein
VTEQKNDKKIEAAHDGKTKKTPSAAADEGLDDGKA